MMKDTSSMCAHILLTRQRHSLFSWTEGVQESSEAHTCFKEVGELDNFLECPPDQSKID